MIGVSWDGRLQRSVSRLALVIFIALLGLAVSVVGQAFSGVRLRQVTGSLPYGKGTEALLAIGFFVGVYTIPRRELRQNARTVLAAITFGVAVKAVLAGSIMALAYGGTGYLLLSVAVVQIDPLSVAAPLQHSIRSQRARSVLSARASFDDPVKVLLVAYLVWIMLSPPSPHDQGALVALDSGFSPAQITLNVALAAVVGLAWYLLGEAFRDCGCARLHSTLPGLVLAGLHIFHNGAGELVQRMGSQRESRNPELVADCGKPPTARRSPLALQYQLTADFQDSRAHGSSAIVLSGAERMGVAWEGRGWPYTRCSCWSSWPWSSGVSRHLTPLPHRMRISCTAWLPRTLTASWMPP